MGKRKVTKQQIQAAEKGKAKAAKRQARDIPSPNPPMAIR
jgi:hypothetical protein